MKWFDLARRRAILFSATGALATGALAVQANSARTTAERFLESVAEARWAEAAKLLDLDAFREYVDHFLARSERSPNDRPVPTVEDLRRRDPSMPREVAEWQIKQMREAESRYSDPTSFEFAGIKSVAQLKRLRIEEAAAKWLEARDTRYVIQRQLEEMKCPMPDADDIPSPRRRLVGTVADGDSTAYAIYREEIEFGGPPSGDDLRVMELTLKRGRWVVQPRGDLLPELSLGLEPGECPTMR